MNVNDHKSLHLNQKAKITDLIMVSCAHNYVHHAQKNVHIKADPIHPQTHCIDQKSDKTQW